MNKQEFQAFIGKEVSDEEFDRAQFVYNESSLDKKKLFNLSFP